MADNHLNIEAERAAFEAWHRSKFATKHSTGQPTRDMHNGVYDENYGPKDQQLMWEVWQAARRTTRTAADGAALDLPPLRPMPKPHMRLSEEEGSDDYPVFLTAQVQAYAQDYARDAIAHHLRKQGGDPVREEQAAVALFQRKKIQKLEAEIADLRAQLASAQQAKEYEQRHAAESEKALAQVQAELAAARQVGKHLFSAVAGQEGEQPTKGENA